jgi:hypothetical protein
MKLFISSRCSIGRAKKDDLKKTGIGQKLLLKQKQPALKCRHPYRLIYPISTVLQQGYYFSYNAKYFQKTKNT